MATNNGFVMVEHENNFEMVEPPAELKMAKRWKEKAKTKRNTRMRKVTNSWKSKAKDQQEKEYNLYPENHELLLWDQEVKKILN